MPKNKLLFAPHYLGTLRYLEKLIPYLKKYEVVFLFTPKVKKQYLPEMINYCWKQNYKYYLIPQYSANKILRKIPFYYPLREALDFQKKVRKLLNDKRIKKIISTFDTDFYNNCLFREAQKIGIETMVLQWALASPKTEAIKKPAKLSAKKIYAGFVKVHLFLSNLILKYLLGFRFKNLKVLGGGNAQKFGVINQSSYEFFKKSGVKEEKMSIVGYLDFDLAARTQEKLNGNSELKNKIARRYQINLNKKNVFVLSTPFHIKDIKIFSDKQQLKYYQKIIKTIRDVLDKNEADILFKIHPAENIALYSPLKKYEVKLYDKDAANEELIWFADLYLGHHSTTNFIPMIMNKQAIFLNLCHLKSIEASKKYFSIKKFISEENELQKVLTDFKNNKLAKQYHINHKIIVKDSINKIINWIG